MTESYKIVLDSVVKHYGDAIALDGLTLSIPAGETFGLLGPNGAGKTTTINILCGLERPTSGSSRLSGMDVRQASVREDIGVCVQSGAVYNHLTGRENAELFGRLRGMTRREATKQARELLDMMGLSSDMGRSTGKYSEGMRRRLSLSMALMGSPPVLFLDEPTAAMDPQSRRAVWEIITGLRGEGRTIVLTTHYIEEAESLCDRVGIIDHGRLIALDAPERLVQTTGKRNLEEAFLHLTGRSIREGGE